MTFSEVVIERQRGLLRFAMVLTGDTRLCEEIVQEVLVRAYERWAHIGALEHPNAYVRRMVVNEFLSWRRKWSRVEPFDLAAHGIAQSDHAEAYAERTAVGGRGGCFVPVNRQDGSGGTSVVYLNVNGGLVEMLVDTKHVGFYTDDQLKQIATTLHLASIGDPSTWFDATTAMPR